MNTSVCFNSKKLLELSKPQNRESLLKFNILQNTKTSIIVKDDVLEEIAYIKSIIESNESLDLQDNKIISNNVSKLIICLQKANYSDIKEVSVIIELLNDLVKYDRYFNDIEKTLIYSQIKVLKTSRILVELIRLEENKETNDSVVVDFLSLRNSFLNQLLFLLHLKIKGFVYNQNNENMEYHGNTEDNCKTKAVIILVDILKQQPNILKELLIKYYSSISNKDLKINNNTDNNDSNNNSHKENFINNISLIINIIIECSNNNSHIDLSILKINTLNPINYLLSSFLTNNSDISIKINFIILLFLNKNNIVYLDEKSEMKKLAINSKSSNNSVSQSINKFIMNFFILYHKTSIITNNSLNLRHFIINYSDYLVRYIMKSLDNNNNNSNSMDDDVKSFNNKISEYFYLIIELINNHDDMIEANNSNITNNKTDIKEAFFSAFYLSYLRILQEIIVKISLRKNSSLENSNSCSNGNKIEINKYYINCCLVLNDTFLFHLNNNSSNEITKNKTKELQYYNIIIQLNILLKLIIETKSNNISTVNNNKDTSTNKYLKSINLIYQVIESSIKNYSNDNNNNSDSKSNKLINLFEKQFSPAFSEYSRILEINIKYNLKSLDSLILSENCYKRNINYSSDHYNDHNNPDISKYIDIIHQNINKILDSIINSGSEIFNLFFNSNKNLDINIRNSIHILRDYKDFIFYINYISNKLNDATDILNIIVNSLLKEDYVCSENKTNTNNDTSSSNKNTNDNYFTNSTQQSILKHTNSISNNISNNITNFAYALNYRKSLSKVFFLKLFILETTIARINSTFNKSNDSKTAITNNETSDTVVLFSIKQRSLFITKKVESEILFKQEQLSLNKYLSITSLSKNVTQPKYLKNNNSHNSSNSTTKLTIYSILTSYSQYLKQQLFFLENNIPTNMSFENFLRKDSSEMFYYYITKKYNIKRIETVDVLIKEIEREVYRMFSYKKNQFIMLLVNLLITYGKNNLVYELIEVNCSNDKEFFEFVLKGYETGGIGFKCEQENVENYNKEKNHSDDSNCEFLINVVRRILNDPEKIDLKIKMLENKKICVENNNISSSSNDGCNDDDNNNDTNDSMNIKIKENCNKLKYHKYKSSSYINLSLMSQLYNNSNNNNIEENTDISISKDLLADSKCQFSIKKLLMNLNSLSISKDDKANLDTKTQQFFSIKPELNDLINQNNNKIFNLESYKISTDMEFRYLFYKNLLTTKQTTIEKIIFFEYGIKDISTYLSNISNTNNNNDNQVSKEFDIIEKIVYLLGKIINYHNRKKIEEFVKSKLRKIIDSEISDYDSSDNPELRFINKLLINFINKKIIREDYCITIHEIIVFDLISSCFINEFVNLGVSDNCGNKDIRDNNYKRNKIMGLLGSLSSLTLDKINLISFIDTSFNQDANCFNIIRKFKSEYLRSKNNSISSFVIKTVLEEQRKYITKQLSSIDSNKKDKENNRIRKELIFSLAINNKLNNIISSINNSNVISASNQNFIILLNELITNTSINKIFFIIKTISPLLSLQIKQEFKNENDNNSINNVFFLLKTELYSTYINEAFYNMFILKTIINYNSYDNRLNKSTKVLLYKQITNLILNYIKQKDFAIEVLLNEIKREFNINFLMESKKGLYLLDNPTDKAKISVIENKKALLSLIREIMFKC